MCVYSVTAAVRDLSFECVHTWYRYLLQLCKDVFVGCVTFAQHFNMSRLFLGGCGYTYM